MALRLTFAAVAAVVLPATLLRRQTTRGQRLSPDMQAVHDRLLNTYVQTFNISGMDADISQYLQLIAPPGMFIDLNYTAQPATGWGGYTHCTRMAEMGSAYVTPSSRYYQSAQLSSALLGDNGVFSWFLDAQPQDEANWWYSIGCGRPVAQLTLQFQSQLSGEQTINATAVMNRAQWASYSSTGTNAADIAVVHIGNGLVNNNETYVAEAFTKLWSTVEYAASAAPSSPEGPKTDGSFMQHGAQLYNGNYGASWTKDVLTNVAVAANTTFNASDAAYGVVTRVILDGCARMIHLPSLQWDPAVIGRQITNPQGQNVVGSGGDTNLLVPQVLRAAGGARADELNALAAALESPTGAPMPSDLTVFYASDYVVQRRLAYYTSVRMISSRTAGGECINGQGIQSLHAADGVQYIMKTGQEYQNIAPTWDWAMLPGITVQINGTQMNCSTADGMGSGTFVGGVTADNLTGIAFMDFNNTKHGQNLLARKAFFFFDGYLLNLGAAISSLPGYRVVTTMDSRLLSGDVQVSTDGGASFSTVSQGSHQYSTPASASAPFLASHQGMGFALYTASVGSSSGVSLLNAPVTGNWSSVGTWPAGPITNQMFTLAVDHGDAPVNAGSYAYAIWPDIDAQAFAAGAWRNASQRYQIASNTAELQAVFDSFNNTLYAVVYGGNQTRVPIPAAIGPVYYIQPPLESGIVVSSYVNASSGNTTLSITFAWPNALVTAPDPLGHEYPFYWQTGARFVECSWPACPGAVATPKGKYFGPPVLKWSCYTNGTIFVLNPPSQADMPDGIVPAMNCAFDE